MKKGAQDVAIVESSDVLVVDVDAGDKDVVQVFLDTEGEYHVVRDSIVRHPACSAEDAMRALGFYLQSALQRRKSAVPAGTSLQADNGPLKGPDT